MPAAMLLRAFGFLEGGEEDVGLFKAVLDCVFPHSPKVEGDKPAQR